MADYEQKPEEQPHAPMWGNGELAVPPPPPEKPQGGAFGFVSGNEEQQDKPPVQVFADGLSNPGQPEPPEGKADGYECLTAPCPPEGKTDLSAGEMMAPMLGVPEPAPAAPAETPPPSMPEPEPAAAVPAPPPPVYVVPSVAEESRPEPPPAPATPAPPGVALDAVGVVQTATAYKCVPVAQETRPPRDLRVVGAAPAAPPPPPPVARRGRVGRMIGNVRGRLPGITMTRGG